MPKNLYRIIATKGWTVPQDAFRVPAALLHKMKVKVVDEGLVPSIEISSDACCLPSNMIPLFPAAAGNHVVAGLDDDGASEEYPATRACGLMCSMASSRPGSVAERRMTSACT